MVAGPKLPNTAANAGILNGPVLDAAHWSMMVKNLDPSTHRLYNAFGLTAGLMVGRKSMDLLTGSTPSGDDSDKDSVPFFLRPLHGVMAYNHYSDDTHDRWLKVVDSWAPAFVGAGGAMAGSYHFAMNAEAGGVQPAAAEALKNRAAMTIEKAELAAKFTQSHPWRGLSGLTSMLGSASGFGLIPGLTNYGTTLSGSFSGAVQRDKYSSPYWLSLQKFISGNKHYYPYSAASMLPRIERYLLESPDKDPKQLRDMVYAVLEPWFDKANDAHVDAFVKELITVREKFFKEGGIPADKRAEAQKELNAKLSSTGLEKTLEKVGLNPAEARIGRNGFLEWVSRSLGYGDKLDSIERDFKQAYAKRAGIAFSEEMLHGANMRAADKAILMKGGAVTALGATMLGALALNARRYHQQDNEEILRCKVRADVEERIKRGDLPKDTDTSNNAIDDIIDSQTAHRRKNSLSEAQNDKPLKFLEWGADGLNSPETLGMHRLSTAMGLTGAGLVGMKIMEALTGRNFGGAVVPLEKIPGVLHPLYKKLAHNPQSDHPKDRWGFVMHLAVPGLFATAGAVGASMHFFRKRKAENDKAEYIDQFEGKMSDAEAAPWTLLTATSAILATPSCNPWLPIPGINYGMSLGTRFTLASGRKVILPGIGTEWTGTESRYPYGPALLRDHMIKYAVNNPSQHPEQLEEMAIGILKPWFKDVTGDQILAFVNKVEADRDQFLAQGGVPEEAKRELEKELIADFKGAGLEQTLREIGLNPLEAHLGNNGISSKIAEYLGASSKMQKVKHEFEEKYTERLAKERGISVPSELISHAEKSRMKPSHDTNTSLSA